MALFHLSKYEWIYDDGIRGIKGTAGRLQGYQGNRWKVAGVSREPPEGCRGIKGIKIFYL
jgi:hypothetical protein